MFICVRRFPAGLKSSTRCRWCQLLETGAVPLLLSVCKDLTLSILTAARQQWT
ncbi:hypothetical protein ATANTOWER_020770, partial [Ataeniobius toweri]|nr:hypothetical protein [Ataeniobius toweri]